MFLRVYLSTIVIGTNPIVSIDAVRSEERIFFIGGLEAMVV